ncbi:anti-adapter protein iraM [Franconibacter sp. IITDAS19]|uniref:anti-adapter protein iraM n=1 Tax=Franconibacter sp. IITDAS19 TaxID=2930569 RepID=UPI001FF9E622|nr:anti-adapter protein iraM [Franconibacter sp. IITDAS19]MCK1967978.1 anti-adapter protein iraM [Franconibacter sp. IITDAS19]
MNWKIIDSLASPDTGSFFSIAQSSRNLKLILWCKGDYFLRQGNILTTAALGLLVDGRPRNISVIHASPYNPDIWQNLVHKTNCPGNTKAALTFCQKENGCLFALCPYGLKAYNPHSGQQNENRQQV